MTNPEWKKFDGSDEQIAEISNTKHGYILRGKYKPGTEACFTYSDRIHNYFVLDGLIKNYKVDYWIIPDDPLREMKIRQAQTGQPVWIKYIKELLTIKPGDKPYRIEIEVTTTPDWHIPNAKYSFKPFEVEVLVTLMQ